METQTHKRKQVSGQSATQSVVKKSTDLDGNLVCQVTKVAEALNSSMNMAKNHSANTNVVILSKPMMSDERLSELCDDLVGICNTKPLKEHTPKVNHVQCVFILQHVILTAFPPISCRKTINLPKPEPLWFCLCGESSFIPWKDHYNTH